MFEYREESGWDRLEPLKPYLTRFAWTVGITSLISLFFVFQFPSYLPINNGWARLERWWFPFGMTNLAFHEAGHIFFGITGNAFITSAGGTLLQLILPIACMIHFWRRESWTGVYFTIFWLGTNFGNISFYAADAQSQSLILISGMTGREGGGHDWGFMLPRLHLLKHSVGVGQFFFFLGCFCLIFPWIEGLRYAYLRWNPGVSDVS